MEGGAFQTYAATSGLSLNLYLCLCSFPSFSSLATLFFLSLALSLSLSPLLSMWPSVQSAFCDPHLHYRPQVRGKGPAPQCTATQGAPRARGTAETPAHSDTGFSIQFMRTPTTSAPAILFHWYPHTGHEEHVVGPNCAMVDAKAHHLALLAHGLPHAYCN